MWTLGIDIAKHSHCAHLLDDAGKERLAGFVFENSHAGLGRLELELELAGAPKEQLRVGMEATGHYWMVLYEKLTGLGYEVVLLNPLVTSARRNATIRGLKTDKTDAMHIAQLLREERLPVSALAQGEVRELRMLTRMRYDLAHQAVTVKLQLGALLDRAFPEYASHFSDLMGMASCAVLNECPTAEHLKAIDVRRLTRLIEKASKGKLGKAKATQLKQAAGASFALSGQSQVLALQIRLVVEQLNLLLKQIDELDARFEPFLKPQQELLRSIPGIGAVWAPTLLAELLPVFDPENQRGARKFVAMAGLDPKLNESGQSRGAATMSKRGSRYLRTAVLQASEVAALRSKDPLFNAIYTTQKQRGKSHAVALSHVAHKMLHVIFAVLRDNKNYKPKLPALN